MNHRSRVRGLIAGLATAGALIGGALVGPERASAQWLTGEASIETRPFLNGPTYSGQHRNDLSFVLAPEAYLRLGPGGLVFEPFARLDWADDERSHVDLRTLSWEGAIGDWELNLGLGRVFWGVSESQHLVDVVNQTDLVENPDGEDKLGQPMIKVGRVSPLGVFELFILPGFRERTFAGLEGRLRPALVVDTDAARYQSGAGSHHLDVAARWSHILGAFDVGVTWFRGTNREPRMLVQTGPAGPTGLVPFYDQAEQFGLDVQWTKDAWLWKLETITRDTDFAGQYWAYTAGFEYTLYQILGDADLGLIAEHLYDDRGDVAPTAFQDDIFVGGRLAMNDVAGSELLFGGIVDRGNGSAFLNLEGSRRLTNNWTVDLQIRAFVGLEPGDFLYDLRRDDHLLLAFRRFF